MQDGRIVRRKLVDDAQLTPGKNLRRSEGTVVHVPMPWAEHADDKDDDSGQHPGSWYVEEKSTGLRFYT